LENGTKDSISKLVSELNAATLETDVDVVVAPPFIYIDQGNRDLASGATRGCAAGEPTECIGRLWA